jgi:hypothetical protein
MILEWRKNMAPVIWSILDRILLASVLIGLVVVGGELNQMRSGNLEMARQIETLGIYDNATEVTMERQISEVEHQHTGQLEKIEAVLNACTTKPSN